MPLGGRFQVGPFDVEFVTLAHSIPEPTRLAIRTPAGPRRSTPATGSSTTTPLVGRPPDEARLAALGDEGVLAMICDSTNALREGRSPSETDVASSLTDIIKGAKRRVAVTTFASNVARVKAVADAARASGRELVVAGRALHRIIDVAMETGYLPENFRYLDQDQFSYLAHDKVRGSLHRQPGRAARRRRPHRRGRASRDRARTRRSRHLLLAHHPRQREAPSDASRTRSPAMAATC